MSGVFIYVLRRIGTNRFYAGSTNNPPRRRGEHFKKLRKNTHPSPPLQAAWNKYGEKAFEFIVVCNCSNADRIFYEELYLKHAAYVCKTKVNEICPVAREKISKAKLGVPLSKKHREALSQAKINLNVSRCPP